MPEDARVGELAALHRPNETTTAHEHAFVGDEVREITEEPTGRGQRGDAARSQERSDRDRVVRARQLRDDQEPREEERDEGDREEEERNDHPDAFARHGRRSAFPDHFLGGEEAPGAAIERHRGRVGRHERSDNDERRSFRSPLSPRGESERQRQGPPISRQVPARQRPLQPQKKPSGSVTLVGHDALEPVQSSSTSHSKSRAARQT